MKQVLGLAQLRGQTALTNEATLLALLLAWALLQSEVQYARHVLTQVCEQWALSHSASSGSLSQQAPSLPTVSSWTVTALGVQTLRVLVQGYWTFARLRSCLPFLRRYLCSRRCQRDHQESTIRRHLLVQLAPMPSDSPLFFFCSSA